MTELRERAARPTRTTPRRQNQSPVPRQGIPDRSQDVAIRRLSETHGRQPAAQTGFPSSSDKVSWPFRSLRSRLLSGEFVTEVLFLLGHKLLITVRIDERIRRPRLHARVLLFHPEVIPVGTKKHIHR